MKTKYQGIVVVMDDTEGLCLIYYEDSAKKAYAFDVLKGQENRPILGCTWLDNAVSYEEIREIGKKLHAAVL